MSTAFLLLEIDPDADGTAQVAQPGAFFGAARDVRGPLGFAVTCQARRLVVFRNQQAVSPLALQVRLLGDEPVLLPARRLKLLLDRLIFPGVRSIGVAANQLGGRRQ